ncbi:FKBP-type peptidyl-prolyl cis-trans isomerase [Mycolicibacterium conceptionense]|uniref:Peptidyl-prolyl cis-trans isomerase n=1 Tax=Mycolicibacterium conceptionense TaxID=451644 RepID=A0A0U1DJT3_9MYCO|nr:FKBP-type peptidyl-prolyl cis-trans isomerase [Mycolicibacterium conceptionense]
MVITDLVVGDGAEAVPGGTVEVHYVGVEYDSGEEFDSSWNRGESIEFPLRGLIQAGRTEFPACGSAVVVNSSFRLPRPMVLRVRGIDFRARR